MQLADALGGFLLKRLRAGREVGVLIAEELIGDLACEQHAQVGLLVDGLADEVHADARADGRDIIRAEQRHDLRQRLDDVLGRDDDLGVVGVQILCTSRAYFRSMASLHMPMANVRMGFLSSFAEMAHTRLLSRPPESRKPSGASASSRFSTPAMSFSRMWVQTVSRSSSQTASTCVMSR